MEQMYLVPQMQFCHYAQKESQMTPPSNRFSQVPMVDRILQSPQELA